MRKSLVYQKNDREFIALFHAAPSLTEFAYSLGIIAFGGGTYFTLKERCEELGLDQKSQFSGALKKSVCHHHETDEEYFSEKPFIRGKIRFVAF